METPLKDDAADAARTTLPLVEEKVARIASAALELTRFQAWNDLLGTIDRLASLLGAEVGPSAAPVPADADPKEIGRFVARWLESLPLPDTAGGTLNARIGVGAVQARLPASMVDATASGTAEYRVARAAGELRAARGVRALKLRGLTLGGQAAVARRDGKVVASVELVGPDVGLDLQPSEPGRFVLAPEGELSMRLGAAGQEVTVSI